MSDIDLRVDRIDKIDKADKAMCVETVTQDDKAKAIDVCLSLTLRTRKLNVIDANVDLKKKVQKL